MKVGIFKDQCLFVEVEEYWGGGGGGKESFFRKMTSEDQAKKFRSDDLPLPRSG